MKITVLYIGSSLLGPLRQAEREINREHSLDLQIAAHNFGAPLSEDVWRAIEHDLSESDVVFVIHVMDGENASRLLPALEKYKDKHRAVVVINCMPELMRRTRMGRLDFGQMFKRKSLDVPPHDLSKEPNGDGASKRARGLARTVGFWIGEQAAAHREKKTRRHSSYLKLIDHVPSLLKFIPNAGRLHDVKNYLYLFCYFLQPTPANIRSMVLYALKKYVPDQRLRGIDVPPPESMPAVAIYHPDAPSLFETFEGYRKWYVRHMKSANKLTHSKVLDPKQTVGLLLMRPQIVSQTRKHYDGLIRSIEAEGLSVLPAISTFMDNREACAKFFIDKSGTKSQKNKMKNIESRSRVSQIVSLTGFSFVGGPAMNDSAAAAQFLRELNRPFRSCVSLDMQTIEAWQDSNIGLNPIQAGMQIAIPEIDGAVEPFVYGGMHASESEPMPLDDRCQRIARRLKRWHRLQTGSRGDLKLAMLLFCFPPNKGNIGTAADLDVFPSVLQILHRLKDDGYEVEVPETADALRDLIIGGTSERYGTTGNVAYRMTTNEYRRLCPFVNEIEKDWGPAPGKINTFGDHLLIQGITLGKVFIGIQPTFGFEGDPMRLMMAQSGSPHHGFMALYTYLEKVFGADAVMHVGTHGAMEFMPGKQVGLSSSCWPDRLIGELPNIYIYSVNNPSEGSIAKRRSYAELISYLTPPIENAGVYKGLASLKELLGSYRQTNDERERELLFAVIQETANDLNFQVGSQ